MSTRDARELVEEHLWGYAPRAEGLAFSPERIILTRGSLATGARRRFVEAICRLFRSARVVEALDRNHMQLSGFLPRGDAARREAGRRTLVVGAIANPLRRSQERGIVCPNYFHFSTTAFCPYGCAYCYLAGSCSTVVAPVLKVFVNLEDVLEAICRRARTLSRPESFYLGKLQDALALDPLTGFSRVLVRFFAGQPRARLVMLTKSDCVGNLLDLDHGRHTAVSWSVNPSEVCVKFEAGAPPLARRLAAARACQQAGYKIRFVIMPVLPVPQWRRAYSELVRSLCDGLEPQRLTIGGICSYPGALRLTRRALGADNLVNTTVAGTPSPDGRRRFPRQLRAELYRHILDEVRARMPGVSVALCLEEPEVWRAVGLDPGRPACNCQW